MDTPQETPQPQEADHPIIARLRRDVSLGQGARQGAAWIGSARLFSQAFQFAVSLITARLLFPSQFGEAALVLAVVLFAQLFTDLGLAAAVVQAPRATRELLSTAFWLNLASGVVLAGLFIGIAVPLADFYDQPNLAGLLTLASLNFVLSCGVVHAALLERTFHFKRIALCETVASVIGVGSIPLLAVAGVGTASLVIGPLLTTGLLAASLWLSVPWRPDRPPSRAAAGRLWRYSRGILGFNTVNYWSRNLDTVLLGRAVSPGALGEYTRAFNVTMIPIQQMNLVLGRVLFPALSRLQDEPARMGEAWVRATSAAGTLVLPVTVTLAATAPFLVPVLYGPRWTGMVPVLELLALATVPQVIAASTGNVYRATGRTGLLFRVGFVNAALAVIAIVVGLRWGTTGVAAALLVQSLVTLPIAVVPLARIVHVSLADAVGPLVTMVLPAAAMAAGELAVRWTLTDGVADWAALLLQLAAGSLLYLLVMWRIDAPALRLLRRRRGAPQAAESV